MNEAKVSGGSKTSFAQVILPYRAFEKSYKVVQILGTVSE
jgi:hypothetical protein